MNFIDRLFGARTDRPQFVVGPSAIVVGPTPIDVVAPPPRFTWDEKRWTRTVDGALTSYLGEYRVFDHARSAWRTFQGRIDERAGQIRAYVADPPVEIREHPKGRCFQLTQEPWFLLHWHRPPENVDASLLYVERVLDECLNAKSGRRRL